MQSLVIGHFARATHISVKTLRHYHSIGLLEPAIVDPKTGYRRYALEQISTAQIIRRFRDLSMPLDDIRAVLTAPNLETRNDLIARHLSRLEESLEQAQKSVATLRDLLLHPKSMSEHISHRSINATPAVAITGIVDVSEAPLWFQGALAELHATLAAQHIEATARGGGVYSDDLFDCARGEVTIFVPCDKDVRTTGRVKQIELPAVEMATIIHNGPHDDCDFSYSSLAAYVERYALSVEGPIREYYLVGARDTPDDRAWRTEICWPIFEAGASRLPEQIT
jgi:DNA-binding transcriptional MerR regulator